MVYVIDVQFTLVDTRQILDIVFVLSDISQKTFPIKTIFISQQMIMTYLQRLHNLRHRGKWFSIYLIALALVNYPFAI